MDYHSLTCEHSKKIDSNHVSRVQGKDVKTVIKHIEILLTLTSGQVIILTRLYVSMSNNLGFMAATKKVGLTDKNVAGVAGVKQ